MIRGICMLAFAQITISVVEALKRSSSWKQIVEGGLCCDNEGCASFATGGKRKGAGLWCTCAIMRVWLHRSLSSLRGFVCMGSD